MRFQVLEQRFVGHLRLGYAVLERGQILFVLAQREADRIVDDLGDRAVRVGGLQPDSFVQRRLEIDRGALRCFVTHSKSCRARAQDSVVTSKRQSVSMWQARAYSACTVTAGRGSPVRATTAANRGSERMAARNGSLPIVTTSRSRRSAACSSSVSARSRSPSARYTCDNITTLSCSASARRSISESSEWAG